MVKMVQFASGYQIKASLVKEIQSRLQEMKLELVDIRDYRCCRQKHQVKLEVRDSDDNPGTVRFDVRFDRKWNLSLGKCLELKIRKPAKEDPEPEEVSEKPSDLSWWVKLHFDELLELEGKEDPETQTFVIPAEMTAGANIDDLVTMLMRNPRYQSAAADKDGKIFVKTWKEFTDEELEDIAEELGY